MKAQDWDARYTDDSRVRAWADTPNRVLVAEAGELPVGRALDLACGLGRNAVWLAEHGWVVTGVDFSPVAIEQARARAAARGVDADFVLADLLDYRPPEGEYDLVLVFFLQLVRDELQAVIGRAAGSVAPDGTFLLVGHDLLNLAEGVGGPSSAEVLYTPEDVTACLGDLAVERAERIERDVPGESRPAIDCFVRARRLT